MLQRISIKKHIRNLRIISYVYLLLCALDDNPQAAFFAVPWILYLLYDSYRVGFLSKKALLHFGLILVFLFSLFYNKSESSLYHPMIGNEIVLPKDIYVSKSYINDKFNASGSNFSLRDEQMVLLPKGEKILIHSFIRSGTLNFNPDYDIEIETTLNQKILDKLDPDGTTKGYKNSQLYFWSNNFFYELGILNNTKVDEYSRTINPLFKLLTFLYPFAFLYLLLQSFKNSMNKIQTNYSFHPLSMILYLVAYYYVLMASINDGFSGFLLGIPYTLFLLWEIWYLKKGSKIKYLHVSILLLVVFLLVSDRSKSQFFYPMVDKTYTITNDINYSYGGFYINKIDIYDIPYYSHLDEPKPMFKLASGDNFRIVNQKVAGHADMGINYTYKIQSKKFSDVREYISGNLAKIKSELSDKYAADFYGNKTAFYFNEENQFYIGDHELRTLMKTQGLPYNKHNIESGFTYMSFYLLIYPVVLGMFFLILTFRNKEIFYGKHNKTVEPIKTL